MLEVEICETNAGLGDFVVSAGNKSIKKLFVGGQGWKMIGEAESKLFSL